MAQNRYAKIDEAGLLELTRADPDAFGEFYDRCEADMLAFFWRATRRPDLAADLTAEVFALALASAPSFRQELGSARAWLFGIARHELADTWQRGRVADRARRRIGVEPLLLSDAAIERVEELCSTHPGVLRLLEDLPEQQRAAVSGRVLDDRDYGELAERLQCSESVVRQRVSRGLSSLRRRLGQTR
jgi:RNA polymerase sigma-70 factor (ECF subfamily)